jgi:hypothetical protein
MNRVVAVLDFGTARTKIVVARSSGGAPAFDTATVETRFGAMSDKGVRRETAEGDERILLRLVEVAARRLGATEFRCVATEAFRSEGSLRPVADAIQRQFGNLTILDAAVEARLFYQAVRRIEQIENFVAADIGGGSVQVVWGCGAGDFVSLPIGTYRLERECQQRTGFFVEAESADALSIKRRVSEALRLLSQCAPAVRGRKLVIGSNIMKDFFDHALGRLHLYRPAGEVRREDIEALFHACAGQRYSDLAAYFPENPTFMFGADKLLIIVVAIMDELGEDSAITTNASVSKGLALDAR